MSLLTSFASILVLVAVIYLGLKLLKNIIVVVIVAILLALVLHYFGYLLP